MSKHEIILSRLKNYDNQSKLIIARKDRQQRLKTLINDHGLADVALASGFNVTTLAQHVSAKIAPSIAEDKVIKAETILKGL